MKILPILLIIGTIAGIIMSDRIYIEYKNYQKLQNKVIELENWKITAEKIIDNQGVALTQIINHGR